MKFFARLAALALLTGEALGAGSAQAALMGYTSKASFDTAIARLSAAQKVNFDALAVRAIGSRNRVRP